MKRITCLALMICWSLALPLKAADPVQHALPEFALSTPLLPDARELYQRTLDCWPIPNHFKGEVALEGRLSPRNDGWIYSNGYPAAGNSTSLVARLPLYSATEMERERERESNRRRRAAEAVGQWLSQVADRQRIQQQLALMKSLEHRARLRVLAGIVDSSEQVHYMEKVAELDGQLLRQNGQIERSRLELLGFCASGHADALNEYLMGGGGSGAIGRRQGL